MTPMQPNDQKQPAILIVEDDVLTARNIAGILEDAGYRVAGIAYNANAAIDMLGKYAIDLVLLDIDLGGGRSGTGIAKIIQEKYQASFIFLTALTEELTLKEAVETRPAGYLVKPFQKATLLATIRLALASNQKNPKQLFENLNVKLTEQELRICRLICEGKDNPEICKALYVSSNTLKYHLKNLYLKFDVNSKSQLIAKLIVEKIG